MKWEPILLHLPFQKQDGEIIIKSLDLYIFIWSIRDYEESRTVTHQTSATLAQR